MVAVGARAQAFAPDEIPPTVKQVYKELTPMKKDQVDLENAVVWIPDSKTPNGIAEVTPHTACGAGVSKPASHRGTWHLLVSER
jgi:hypothetical protein